MKRTSLVALLALVAALFGGSVTLVLLLTGEAPSAGSPPAKGADAPPPPPSPSPAARPPPSRAPPDAGPMKMRASSWNAPAGVSASPMASRVIRKIVRKALLAAPVQSRLARCADSIGGFGGREPGPTPRGKPAILVLELEGQGDEVRIVDAQVQRWGGASEAAVSCARGVLTGHVVRASTALQERMRMPFPLNPRSEVVASSR